jgi:hypothetical protein
MRGVQGLLALSGPLKLGVHIPLFAVFLFLAAADQAQLVLARPAVRLAAAPALAAARRAVRPAAARLLTVRTCLSQSVLP